MKMNANTWPIPAPGWYPDPRGTGGQSYWNGTDWMHQSPSTQPAERRFTIHYGFALLAVLSLLGTLIPSILWFVVAGGVASDPGTNTDPDSVAAATGISATFGLIWLLWGGMWTLIWAAFAINHTLKARRA